MAHGRGSLGKFALPTPARRLVRAATTTATRVNADKRALPNFLIIGAQRAGTTSLFYYLLAHENVFGPIRNKGVHWYDSGFHHPPAWYRSHFPLQATVDAVAKKSGQPTAVGEGSPYYLYHPQIAARIAGALPTTKVIALLRDPVDRAISHHQHELARGFETLPLADAIAAEESRLDGEAEKMAADPTYVSFADMHFSYAARGRYAEQIERYHQHLGRDQVLVLDQRLLLSEPEKTVRRAFDFLGIPPLVDGEYPTYNKRDYDKGDAEVRATLAEKFIDANERLAELTDGEIVF